MINYSKIDTVIFDMDGVLINSEPLWVKAEIKVFESVGIDFLAVSGEKTVGLRIDEVVDFWYREFPWKNKTKNDVVNEIMQEMVLGIKKEGEALPGVYEALDYFKANNYKIGLASSSFEILINTTLDKLKIRDYFDVILSAEKLEFGKPHPEIYIKAAKELRTTPSSCLVIEDSLNGVIAAKAAKMNVVAIPDGTHSPDKRIILADLKLDSLNELLRFIK